MVERLSRLPPFEGGLGGSNLDDYCIYIKCYYRVDLKQSPPNYSYLMPQVNQTLATNSQLDQYSTLELAQALAQRMAIAPNDWHRLKGNRKAQAGQQAAAALVFLLKDSPEEALVRLNQATGWLDRSISAPPCPTHGTHGNGRRKN